MLRYMNPYETNMAQPIGAQTHARHVAAIASLLQRDPSTIGPNDMVGWTMLHTLSVEGDTDGIRLLLWEGEYVNAIYTDGRTPLWIASSMGHRDVVELLLSNGANPNIMREDGRTPLHRAIVLGHKDVVEVLLSNGADIHVKEKYGRTPLHEASYNGHKDVVEALFAKGADPNVAKNDGWTPLHLASCYGHKDVLELLITKGADILIKQNDGWTPLYSASYNGHKDVVEALLAKGADPSVACNDVVELLITKGADIHIKQNFGWTPLNSASKNGHEDVVEALLAKGADPSVACNYGWTPLNSASKNGHKDVVEALHAKGADPNVANNNGWTPLNSASDSGHKDVVEALLAKGADPNVANSGGGTPLHSASNSGHKDVVKLLLTKGANIHIQTGLGNSSLIIEVVHGILQEYGTMKEQMCALQLNLDTSEATVASLEHQVHTLDTQLQESVAKLTAFEDGHRTTPLQVNEDAAMVRIDPDTCTRVSIAYVNQLTDHFGTHRVVGRGAFGTAYRGIDTVTNLTLIVKQLQSDTDFESNRDSVEKEVELLERIRHPNIIRLLGWSLSPETQSAYLVYEHGEHGSLADNLVDDTKACLLVPSVRMRIAAGIAKALAFMHNPEQGGGRVFHRDIKSANVVLSATFEPKVIDCGLAFMVPDTTHTQPTFTVTTEARQRGFGTPAYSCPTYLRNNSRYGERNEVYSLGLVLSELYSGSVLESMDDDEDIDEFRCDAERSDLQVDTRCIPVNDDREENALETLKGVARQCLRQLRNRPSTRAVMMELVALDRQQQAHLTPHDIQRQTECGWRLRLEVETQQRLRLEDQLRAETAALRNLRDEAMERERNIEARTVECLVCYEKIVIEAQNDIGNDTSTAVDYLSCGDGHTLCRDCAQSHIRECCNVNYNGPGRVKATHELLCPNHPGECSAGAYTSAQLAVVLEPAAYEIYLRSLMVVRERELAAQFQNDLERTLAERQRESDIDKHARTIREDILTLRCPNGMCRRGFVDFDGCAAVTCDLCNRAFCGLCLEDCGNDAHAHVANCMWNPNEDGFVYVEKKLISVVQNRVRVAKVRDYINNLKPDELREGVEERVRAELADLMV